MIDYRVDTFLLLCELMNYRKTADTLGLTQPAVTQQIHHLEQEYGCKLFDYKNSRLQKTDEAVIFEQYARAMRLQEQHLRSKLNSSVWELKIGATKTIGDYVLKEKIRAYLKHEDHALTYVVDNTTRLLGMLSNNELDFAVVEGYFDRSRFDSQLLQKEPFIGICSKDHPFSGREITLEELFHESIIHREAGSGTREILEQKLSGYNESLSHFKRQICISSFPVILDLVKQNYGVSFVYEVLANSDSELGKFTISGEEIVREFNIVYLKYADVQKKIDSIFGCV